MVKIMVTMTCRWGKDMNKVFRTFKNVFLDLFSMGKGFVYGFVMVGLFIVICGALIYGVLYITNVIF
ncbi:hypothetical protein FN924_15905 [Radiobacillus deserti]|uniref:Uncharacterized protein n=1 Tax=Radiobacillus deserti TaxID=2594883 RepID=A0A516KJF6_9BACI|nr:hypothetical protein FN924_15905 [Radiobacillus deserti]